MTQCVACTLGILPTAERYYRVCRRAGYPMYARWGYPNFHAKCAEANT